MKNCIILLFILFQIVANAQKSAEYLPEKPGKVILNQYSMNMADELHRNVKHVAEWFIQNAPVMTNPKGFDLWVYFTGYWNDKYKLQPGNYGRRGELNFDFRMYLSNGGTWTVEPPHWSFEINNTETGHGTNPNFPGWDNTKDPESLEKPMDNAAADLNDLFRVFPLVRDIAPGVRLYGGGNLIVFNPDRPPFWLPVTVREVANMKLAYYKLKDTWLLPKLKEEIAKLNEAEMNSPAYSGNEELFVLDVHPMLEDQEKENGGKLMRFNPDYWDRSLPVVAVQYLSWQYRPETEEELEKFIPRNGGLTDFVGLFFNSLPVEKMGVLIDKK